MAEAAAADDGVDVADGGPSAGVGAGPTHIQTSAVYYVCDLQHTGAASAEATPPEDGVALTVGGPSDSVGAGLPPLRLSSGIPASPSADAIDKAQRRELGEEAGQAGEGGSTPSGSEAVRSAMANTRTAELASLAEQADIRWAVFAEDF